jgi:hypothetical protein
MKTTKTKQLSVSLENRPGRLAHVCKCLAERKINIIALSVLETSEQGILRLVVDKPDEAAKMLKKCPMTVSKKDVLLVELPNKVGVMATVAEKLAAKGINITFVYGSTGKTRGITHVVLAASNLAASKKLLARM